MARPQSISSLHLRASPVRQHRTALFGTFGVGARWLCHLAPSCLGVTQLLGSASPIYAFRQPFGKLTGAGSVVLADLLCAFPCVARKITHDSNVKYRSAARPEATKRRLCTPTGSTLQFSWVASK